MSTYQPPNGGPAISSVILVDGSNQPAAVSGGGGGGVPMTAACTAARLLLPNSDLFSFAAGAYEISVANVGTVNAMVAGATLKPNEAVTYRAPSTDILLGSIGYSGTGAELLVTFIMLAEA